MPKVSVVMPVYNGERFLEQAIDSLLAQTFQDWELVVVDDGSRDQTAQILAKYTDTRIRVFQQANRGEAGARNTGLRQMTGEYMAFLDADDIYLPNALQDLSAYLDAHPKLDVVFSDGYVCDHEDRQLMRLTEIRPYIYTGNILDPLVLSPSVITVPVCTMTRISKVREYDLFFDEANNLIGTDWDFWIRLAVHVEFGYLDKLTCKYRIHTTNITRTTGAEKRKNDELYRRMKIMNSEWFGRLSQDTREQFFFDLLTNVLSNDDLQQQQILKSQQLAALSPSQQADLWRSVGIDALKNGSSLARINYYIGQSYKINPTDNKTRGLLWALRIGRVWALALVKFWHFILAVGKKTAPMPDSRSEHLQKLMGIK